MRTEKFREPWERFDDDIHVAFATKRLCEQRWQTPSVASPHEPAKWVLKGNSDGYRYIDLWSPPTEPDEYDEYYYDYEPDD